MFESNQVGRLAGLVDELGRLQAGDPDLQIGVIDQLERVASAVSAAQVRVTAGFAAARRGEAVGRGKPADHAAAGIAGEVALAKRTSPQRARRFVGFAWVLTSEMPNTLRALERGELSEWRAMILVRETAWLSREHRALIDRDLVPRLVGAGDKRVEAMARQTAYALDPVGAAAHLRNAPQERRVTLRPAPDTMTRLTALLPVAQGVAAYAALSLAADSARANGDERNRGQVMADTLVTRITGQQAAADVSVCVNLIMSDAPHTPAVLIGHGPIPATTAMDLIRRPSAETPMWLRRLYTKPKGGQLVAMDSRCRTFTQAQREFILLRDQICRTPYCDAPIRHTDHINPATNRGPTEIGNAQGLCEACNYTKQAPGWQQTTDQTTIRTTTPTGRRYRSEAPDPPSKAA